MQVGTFSTGIKLLMAVAIIAALVYIVMAVRNTNTGGWKITGTEKDLNFYAPDGKLVFTVDKDKFMRLGDLVMRDTTASADGDIRGLMIRDAAQNADLAAISKQTFAWPQFNLVVKAVDPDAPRFEVHSVNPKNRGRTFTTAAPTSITEPFVPFTPNKFYDYDMALIL